MNCYLARRLIPAVCSVAAVLVAVPDEAFAQSSTVEWTFYGGARLPEQEVCFFDAAGVTGESAATIRVWTKCLRQKDLDSIDVKSEVGKTISQNVARKLAHGYVPSITQVEHLNADQSIDITRYEVQADTGDLQPQASIFYELNCSARMMRELSMSFISRGKRTFTDKPTDWKYVPPEGNVARLLKMLCPGR